MEKATTLSQVTDKLILLVEETGVPGEGHHSVASY